MAAAALPRRSPREVTSSGHWRKRAAAGHNETLEGRLEEVRLLADVEDVHGGRQLLWRLHGAAAGVVAARVVAAGKREGGGEGASPPPSGSISATSRLQVEAPHLGLEESDADVARVDAHAGCGSTYRGEDVSWSRRREAGPALSEGRGAPKRTICSGSPPMPSTCSLSPCASVTYSRPLPIAMPIGVCRTGGDA